MIASDCTEASGAVPLAGTGIVFCNHYWYALQQALLMDSSSCATAQLPIGDTVHRVLYNAVDKDCHSCSVVLRQVAISTVEEL